MSSLQLGSRLGGRQAPRRESLLALRYGRLEFAATMASVLYGALAWYLVGELGLTTSEAVARTVRVGLIWDGFQTSLVAFGFDRPPLLTALAVPFGGIDSLREHGLTAALTTAAGSGVSVFVAGTLARSAGLTSGASVLFVAAFALNPLLVYAGVLGLPEMVYASLMLVAIWQFGEWVERRDVASVVVIGVIVGVAFLLRYNVLVVAAVAGWAFWWVGREQERETYEEETARATALAFAVPVVFVVGLWTLVAWFPQGELFGYLRQAADLSRLGAEDIEVIQRTEALRRDVLGTAAWVGRWTLLIAPLSVLSVVASAALGIYEGNRGRMALALVAGSVVLPEAVALFSGHGQAHVPHLFVAVVPAFALLAHRERRITGGVQPSAYERPRRRAQLAWCSALVAASAVSAWVIVLMPATDPPAEALEEAVRTRSVPAAASVPADAQQMADLIRVNAGGGDVVADISRHASVMLAAGDLSLFQTDASHGEEATLFEPFGSAGYVLTRRPLPDQGPGRIERAYEGVFMNGAPSLSLAFEAGDYRLYAVTGPAIP